MSLQRERFSAFHHCADGQTASARSNQFRFRVWVLRLACGGLRFKLKTRSWLNSKLETRNLTDACYLRRSDQTDAEASPTRRLSMGSTKKLYDGGVEAFGKRLRSFWGG